MKNIFSDLINTWLQPGDHKRQNSGNGFNRFRAGAIFASAILSLSYTAYAGTPYTAHEWGTFTSVQGSDGNLLSWNPLQSSELPKFVYSTKAIPFTLSKSGLITLQRLETPVIYFYAKEPMKVDVDVSFPRGFITEWYPQLTTLNPTHAVEGSTVFTQTESRAIWRGLDILPDTKNATLFGTNQLPQDSAGSHYFAARQTAANYVRARIATNNSTDLEKFIFYRGAGSFQTPLRVTLDTNNVVTVENTGAQPLAHLFLLNIHDGQGAFAVLDELAPSNSVHWQQLCDTAAEHWNRFDLPQFKNQIAAQVQAALVNVGLYPDEALAMVNTWRDSWFTEDGVRVLYLLPRPWTDEILPLTLTPAPADLTRVMVGRAEVITPQVETNLFQLLSTAQTGDTNAQAQATSEFKHLNRFASPALQLAMAHTTNTTLINFSYQLYSQQQTPAKPEAHLTVQPSAFN